MELSWWDIQSWKIVFEAFMTVLAHRECPVSMSICRGKERVDTTAWRYFSSEKRTNCLRTFCLCHIWQCSSKVSALINLMIWTDLFLEIKLFFLRMMACLSPIWKESEYHDEADVDHLLEMLSSWILLFMTALSHSWGDESIQALTFLE